MTSPRPLAGVVLAAGRATRMGRPKVVLPWGGRSLLAHVCDALAAAGVDLVAIVRGPDTPDLADLPLGDRIVVDNPDAAQGMGGSIAAGVRAVAARGAAAALLCLGDQPGISPRTIRALAGALRPPHLAAAPVYRGGHRGHPVLFGAALFPELVRLRGDVGARGLLAAYPSALVPVDLPPPPDVDTPRAYASLLAMPAPAYGARRRGGRAGGSSAP